MQITCTITYYIRLASAGTRDCLQLSCAQAGRAPVLCRPVLGMSVAVRHLLQDVKRIVSVSATLRW